MDAYSNYIMTISKARTSELRQEAAEFALSAGARRRRRQRWAQALQRLLRPGRMPAPVPQSLPPQAWASNSSASSR
jgi:hypothetical protein